MSPLDYWPLILTMIGGLVWIIRLEGRLNAHEEVDKQRYHEVADRLARIERLLDTLVKMNGK